MYIIDFFKKVARKSNIPVIIYLVLNTLIITFVFCFFACANTEFNPMVIIFGIMAYMISLMIALSPFGEWVLRFQTGCHKIKDEEQLAYIEPIFREVYRNAQRLDPEVPDDVELFINHDQVPNAFATGRKTICITEGLLQMPVGQIKATLAHEFGHLAHKDTDLILVVCVGNMIVSGIILGIRIFIEILHIVLSIVSIIWGGSEGLTARIASAVYHLLLSVSVSVLSYAWTKLGILLVMKSSRENEFEADEFAYDLGYGNELCALLSTIKGTPSTGLFANLASSHPDNELRIQRLQELG